MNFKISIVFLLFLFIKLNISMSLNSYYLIDIDTNSSINNNSCTNIFLNKNLYHIPHQCHKHLLCTTDQCDDKSFRCIKIRETLCCIYKYIQKYCSNEQILKDQFRLIYFHISIQHGYCEINLERIEQNDHSYCLANHFEITTTAVSLSHLPLKRFQQNRHRLAATQSSHLPTNISSKSSFFLYEFYHFIIINIILCRQINTFFLFF